MWHTQTFRHVEVLPMIGLALGVPWLTLGGVDVRGLLARAALTVTGYLRPRPDPAIERVLRTAFSDVDRKLAEILGDRTPHDTHG